MFDFDKWQEIFSSLGRHKLRTLLTAFGVFWGIFMLTLLLGVGKGLENGVRNQFSRSATNRANFWGRSTKIAYRGLQAGRWIRFTNDDIDAIWKNVPEATAINASQYLWGEYAVNFGTQSGSFSVEGVLPDYVHAFYRKIIDGRFLNVRDIEEVRKVAVIGKRVRDILFKQQDPVGQYILIKGVMFQVVGVFDVAGFGENERGTERLYVPITAIQTTFQQGDYVGSIHVVVDPETSVKEAQNRVTDLLKRRHIIASDDERAIGTWDSSEEFQKFQDLFKGIRMFLWIVGTGTLIAGVVGVSNIMLIIVKERTREFGIRKALGATPFSIVSLIIQEAIFLTGIAGYLGLVASVAALEATTYVMENFGLQSEFFSRPEVEMSIAFTAVAILILAGAVAGFIPAKSAVNINPIEALRSE
jgi:putative ABC transport system permease protein